MWCVCSVFDRLGITSKEKRYKKTIIGLDEKYDRKNEKRRVGRRNEEGLTKREQDKKDRIEKIKVLLSKGLNQSKIAQELGISRQAVSKLCKEI